MLEIFLKIKKKQNARIPENNISVMLALQISLDYIASESKDVINALRHLSLCPNGLSDLHCKKLSKDWVKWVDLLKDRSLIYEKRILEEDLLKKNTNRDLR